VSAYQLGHSWKTEQKRLQLLENFLDPLSIRHLERIGVAEGWSCLEVGAGAGSITKWLCKRVAPQGRVVAIDLETGFLEGFDDPNLEVRKHDIVHEELEKNCYDLIHARAVLQHLSDRDRTLHKMVDALKPGGWLLVGDADYISFVAQSEEYEELFDRGKAAFFKALKAAGWDPNYGRRLGPAFRRQKLTDVQVSVRAGELGGASPAQYICKYAFDRVRDQVINEGLLEKQEADAFLQLLTAPDFYAFSALMCYAWGRKSQLTITPAVDS
jgi:SAM-dependent methyltransferase